MSDPTVTVKLPRALLTVNVDAAKAANDARGKPVEHMANGMLRVANALLGNAARAAFASLAIPAPAADASDEEMVGELVYAAHHIGAYAAHRIGAYAAAGNPYDDDHRKAEAEWRTRILSTLATLRERAERAERIAAGRLDSFMECSKSLDKAAHAYRDVLARAAAAERERDEARAKLMRCLGTWRCSGCGAGVMPGEMPDTRWRSTGDGYEHQCGDAQAGCQRADLFMWSERDLAANVMGRVDRAVAVATAAAERRAAEAEVKVSTLKEYALRAAHAIGICYEADYAHEPGPIEAVEEATREALADAEHLREIGVLLSEFGNAPEGEIAIAGVRRVIAERDALLARPASVEAAVGEERAMWRNALEWATGLDADAENHTPEWAAELVRSIREIGNREPADRDASENLLRRIVKYAREDRARTPGVTRLARALDEADKLLALRSRPQPAATSSGEPAATNGVWDAPRGARVDAMSSIADAPAPTASECEAAIARVADQAAPYRPAASERAGREGPTHPDDDGAIGEPFGDYE